MDNIGVYTRGKHDSKSIKYAHPLLEKILDVTYGVMVYQEQVIKAAQVLAGYSVSAGDELRAMISKKKMHLFDAERQVFVKGDEKRKIAGCVANGVSEQIANKIFDDIVKFGDYAFNKSHATAYAYLAYQTAYLKTHHTVEYITAVLNNRINNIDDIANYLRYLKNKNITVLPPCINKSKAKFSVENGAVRIGLAAIKNIGAGIIAQIINERDTNGDFKDFEDFVKRLSFITINKRIFEGFIQTGTFDCFKKYRSQLMLVFETVVAQNAKDNAARQTGQLSLFDNADFGMQIKTDYPNILEYSLGDKLRREKECAGVYLTGHPLEEYAEFLSTFSYNSSHFEKAMVSSSENDESEHSASEQNPLSDNQRVSLGGMFTSAQKRFSKAGHEFGIAKLEDLLGSVEVMISGRSLNKYRELFVSDNLVHVGGVINYRDDKPTFWIDEIKPVGKNALNIPVKKICFYFDVTNKELLNEISDICLAYKGNDETYIRSSHDNKLYPLKLDINICNPFLTEIQGLLGKDGYKIVGP